METPSYIKSLLTPTTKAPQGRKVWSVDLENVWLPFFTATNANGDTAIPVDALGAPLRLAYDKAGQPRFSTAGRPVIRVAKDLSDNIKMVRDNFTANLIGYAGRTAQENPEALKAQIELSRKAGAPILNHDNAMAQAAMRTMAEAEAKAKAEELAKAEAEAKTEAENIVKAKAVKNTQKQPVMA
ncbi:MAG: hypothetical protein Q8O55_03910 [Dehalococcoidales bacterium]|nr:hypothetical protein [Dehalococcoidales bacterium]